MCATIAGDKRSQCSSGAREECELCEICSRAAQRQAAAGRRQEERTRAAAGAGRQWRLRPAAQSRPLREQQVR